MGNQEQCKKPSLWGRFLLWLGGDSSPPERLRFELPKSGSDTDIMLSDSQKKSLQDAVDTSFYSSSETSLYSRETTFRTRSRKAAGKQDDVII